jgi:hypothetical protein
MRVTDLIALSVCMAISSLDAAAPARPPAEAIAELLKSKHKVKAAVAQGAGADAAALAVIDEAITNYQHLRLSLAPGASVFDYPGLLALGDIVYDARGRYRLRLGVTRPLPRGVRPPPEHFFAVAFDSRGTIKSITFRLLTY